MQEHWCKQTFKKKNPTIYSPTINKTLSWDLQGEYILAKLVSEKPQNHPKTQGKMSHHKGHESHCECAIQNRKPQSPVSPQRLLHLYISL